MKLKNLDKIFLNPNTSGSDMAKEMIDVVDPFFTEFSFDEETFQYTFNLLVRIINRWKRTTKLFFIYESFAKYIYGKNIDMDKEYNILSVELLLKNFMTLLTHKTYTLCRKKINQTLKKEKGYAKTREHIFEKLRVNYPIFFSDFFLSGDYLKSNIDEYGIKCVKYYLSEL